MTRLATVLALAAAALVAVPAASSTRADGCPPSDCGTATVAVPGSPVLAVRPGGARGPVVAYDLASGARSFRLPAGLLSADGRVHVVSRVAKTETLVERWDARRGGRTATWTLAGRWWPNAVSADGRRLVLADVVSGRRTATRFAVVDTASGRLLRSLRLRGHLEAEAVSLDGRHLFLVQYVRRGYVVRGYDLDGRALTTLRAKGDPALMGGAAWGAVPSADGRWLLTLYLEPDGGAAVHALDLVGRRAACIDLPAGSFEDTRQYAILVAPGGRAAVAANPALGVVARIDLARLRVAAVTRFAPLAARPFGNTGAVSRDGRRAVFSAESSVWRYDLGRGTVSGPVQVGRRVLGLGFAPDGRARAVRFDGRVVTLRR